MTTSETFDVPEVHCGHCVVSIEGAVAALEGVDQVEVSLEGHAVSVVYDNVAVERTTIVDTIEGQGYAVTGRHDSSTRVVSFARPLVGYEPP